MGCIYPVISKTLSGTISVPLLHPGFGGIAPEPEEIPQVVSSIIHSTKPGRVTVTFDRPMMMGCDAKSQVTLLADTAPVVIHSIEFHPADKSIMEIIVGNNFLADQVVTWQYATGACMIQGLEEPQTEMDLLVHDVDNQLQQLPLVPVVQSSIITVTEPDRITVQWDRPMMMGCDAKSQVTLLADAAPVIVHSIEFQPSDKSIMRIIVGSPFVAGQVVTWQYATGACMIQELALPQTEMDTQVYDVENQIVLLNQWMDESGEAWIDENSEKWLT